MKGTFVILVSNELDEDQKSFLEETLDEFLFDTLVANEYIDVDAQQEWGEEHETEFHTKMLRIGSSRTIH